MLRELRRFTVRDDEGRLHGVSEVVTSHRTGDGVTTEGEPTFLTTIGWEAFPTGTAGEYRIPRTGQTVREV